MPTLVANGNLTEKEARTRAQLLSGVERHP